MASPRFIDSAVQHAAMRLGLSISDPYLREYANAIQHRAGYARPKDLGDEVVEQYLKRHGQPNMDSTLPSAEEEALKEQVKYNYGVSPVQAALDSLRRTRMDLRVKISQDVQSDGYRISIINRADPLHKKAWDFRESTWKDANMTIPLGDGMILPLPGDDGEILQALAEALYEKGFLPKTYVPSKTELDSKNAHIKDLSRITDLLIRRIPESQTYQVPVDSDESSAKSMKGDED